MPATSSSTSADSGSAAVRGAAVFPTLLRYAALCLLLTTAFPAFAQRSAALVSEHGNLFGTMRVQDSLLVRTMLESGIPFPLIDSALVWAHPELFHPLRLEEPVRFRMASGARYVARYKLPAGLRAGDSRSLCPSYIVDLAGRSEKLLYPLQTFTTDSLDAPGTFCLDLRRGELRMLREEELPQPGGAWRLYELTCDERTGMYCVAGRVSFDDGRGGCAAGRMELILDLGNANLLALFTAKPRARELVERSGIARQGAESRSGRRFDVLLPARVNILDSCAFEGFPVLLLDGPMRLPGEGFLGVRFFERYRTIFDLRHGRLWLAPQSEP